MFGSIGTDAGHALSSGLAAFIPTLILLVLVVVVGKTVIGGAIRALPMGKILLVVAALLFFGIMSFGTLQHVFVAIIVFFAQILQMALAAVMGAKH